VIADVGGLEAEDGDALGVHESVASVVEMQSAPVE